MAYGVLPEGFVIKPLTQIQADIVARLTAASEWGPGIDYGSTTPEGQIIGAIASEVAEVWELGYVVHTSGDTEGALGVPLDQVLSLAGSARQGEQASTVVCTLSLDAGTTVPAGSLISVDGRPDIQFELDEDVTNGTASPADFPGAFTCTALGPINVLADMLTVIDTSVSGWTAVTNPSAAVAGRYTANDIEFRQRNADERAAAGSTTTSAIRAALLDTETNPDFETIEKVLVLENKTDATDANGLPPHSVEAIIDDGAVPSVDDDAIAQVIWDHGAAGGIDTYGNTLATATDSEGVEHAIYFSRVTRKDVYLVLTVETTSRFPVDGLTKVAQALVTAGNGYDVEDDVIALYVRAAALTVTGVTDVPDFALGFNPFPTADENLVIGYRERATFSTDRVTVTEA